MNWMNSPNVMVESEEAIKVTNPGDELLEITIHEKVSDQSFDFGVEPSLQKDGVEAHLQELLAADPEVIEPGFKLVKREFMTPIGPVDLLCQDNANSYFAIEIKRRGEIDGVEQLARYLEFIDSEPQYRGVRGIFVAQSIKPQAKVLAEKRSIACLEVDYDQLRGIEKPQQALF